MNYNENQDVFERFSRHIFEHVFDYSDCTFNIQQSPFKLLPCLLNSKSLTIQIHLTCNFRFRWYWFSSNDHDLSTVSETSWTFIQKWKSLLIYQSTIHQPADPKIPFKQLNQLKLNLAERISPLTTLQPQLFYYPIKSLRYAPLNQEDFCLIFQLPVLLVRIVQLFHTEKLRKSFAKDISYYSVKSKLLFYY